jgi:hypothetical protein
MSGRRSQSSADSYSPQRRTALLLTGTGTAGAYHAGVLRALSEAGVKLDIAAGRGVGALGALFVAIDGAHVLWSDDGFWRRPSVRRLYSWRPTLRVLVAASVIAVGVVALPLGAMALGLVVYPVDFLLKMIGVSGGGLTRWYLELADAAFAPAGLPTWLPRLAVLVLGVAGAWAVFQAFSRVSPRQARGPWWWRVVPAPLSAEPVITQAWAAVWDSVRGAAPLKAPTRVDLARRYTELLNENLGQPGFRELLIVVHDIDAGRDLVFAFVAEPRRRELLRPAPTRDADTRRAEVFDLAGSSRDHLPDALAAALTVPLATDFHEVRFAADAYWRGETHRLCDRPGSLERALQELAGLGAEQVILVSAAPESAGPHSLTATRLDPRGRLGEYVRSSESAAVRDVLDRRRAEQPRVFVIRPTHNAVGPFDFEGGFDDRSDRTQHLTELVARGYEDAYHLFIDPIVGASGERVGQETTTS